MPNSRKMLKILLKFHIRTVAVMIIAIDKFLSLKKMVRLMAACGKMSPYRKLSREYVIDSVADALKNPRQMKRRKCLRLGLMNFHFLLLTGERPGIHFSVAPPLPDSNRLLSHCWVSLPDGTILDPPAENMKILWSFPSTDCSGKNKSTGKIDLE